MLIKEWYFDNKGNEREAQCIKALTKYWRAGNIVVTRGLGRTAELTFGLPYTSSSAYAGIWNCQAEAHLKGDPNWDFRCVAIDTENRIIAVFEEHDNDFNERLIKIGRITV